MLTEHVEATGSPKAREILDHLEEKAACFKKILPRDYDRMLRTIAEFEAQGLSHEQAEVEAFSASRFVVPAIPRISPVSLVILWIC